jgi:two-component system sensor histidine kinase HydH
MRDQELIVFVGMDIAPYEQARSVDFQGTLLTSATLLVLGFAAVVSLFWAQSHRVSKRLLRDTRAFASEVVGNMPAALAVVDPAGRLAMVNASMEAFLGRASPDIVGRRPPRCCPGRCCAWARTRSGNRIGRPRSKGSSISAGSGPCPWA